MRIIIFCVTVYCLIILVQSADEHRPKKKDKRQLDHALSQYYSGPHSYRLERRISNGLQHPSHYPQTQFYPGPPRPYRKDPAQDLTNGNHVSDPIDRGGHGDTIYIPHKPFIKIVEKPVFIKEPEPIIEIIIKESNISLPPPPTEAPPPPQKKKKEEVQVFYVKYKKNPNGYGKDSVIYDKPIPAIAPIIPEEPEPEEEWKDTPDSGYGAYANEVTEPPKPSTTLRTIIKPDSEVYHSPGNNVKVTFGKEGFDYDKRSSKPEDYPGPPIKSQEEQPRARQLSSFSDVYFKRPAQNYFPSSSEEYRTEVRAPQPYRPFNNFPQSSNQYNSRSPNREFNSRPPPSFFPPSKYPYQHPPYTKPSTSQQSSRPSSFPSFSHSISHPPPPQYQSKAPNLPPPSHQQSSSRYQHQHHFSDVPPASQRKPVPYTPFEHIRPSQPTFSQALPTHDSPHQSFVQSPPTQPTTHHPAPTQQLPHNRQNIQFRPETRFNYQQQAPINRPAPSYTEVNSQFKIVEQPRQEQHNQAFHNVQQQQPQLHLQQQPQQHQNQHPQSSLSNEQNQYQEHLNNLRTAQNILPPGGELLQSLPKFEQHLIVDPASGQLSQASPLESPQQHYQQEETFASSSRQNDESLNRAHKQIKQKNQNQQSTQQYLHVSNSHNVLTNQPSGQTYTNQRSAEKSASRSYSSTTAKPTTTTQEPEKPSTTTKDPKILEAQLPDEVPEDLRQQLLSSGILNNADISILDYDKVGDIPLSALPPDQLANFYGAGGAQQLAAAGSEQVPQVAALTARRDSAASSQDQEMSAEESEISEVTLAPSQKSVEMKVVKYNPDTDKGQKIQESYISDAAKQVEPVVLNDNSYNRYLPLKVNGTQFPIPDVPELKGKRISSVVVLAPISYDFSSTRKTRETNPDHDLQFIQNGPLKELLANPTQDNYKNFLDSEKNIAVSKQAVILLVTKSGEREQDMEIFMYDIATKNVSKLSGELSSAFVEAAEANSSDEPSGNNAGLVASKDRLERH